LSRPLSCKFCESMITVYPPKKSGWCEADFGLVWGLKFMFWITVFYVIKVLSPTDAQENCLKRSIKIYIKTTPTFFFNFFIITNLIHKFFVHSHKLYKIKFLYMFRAQFAHHREVNDAVCTYAASGIVTLCKWLSCATAKEGNSQDVSV